ncbi:MAG: phosphoglucosamine mutase [Chitinophagaceae bacterium]|nr:phosphoglucosamine mutase [Chitinophagaceae bacterium]
MTLIQSISGIRGTIGGTVGDNLTPQDVVKFASAFGMWILEKNESPKIVIGRDARPSGELVTQLVSSTLRSLGIHVIDLGLSTTPTVEYTVKHEEAAGGIVITASHNPGNWNALKLLNEQGEVLTEKQGNQINKYTKPAKVRYAEYKKIGTYTHDTNALQQHIDAILALPLVDKEAIAKRNFKVVVDAVNSSGGFAVPQLLEALGVTQITKLFCEPNGNFPHNPEPLAENLTFISSEMERGHFDLGIVVDPDVDRLCFIKEDGGMFGEEYTLVAVADYILKHTPGNTVSNLSSTRALRDITEKAGQKYLASPVGEAHVVAAMKKTKAVIGGEGNGGIIYPELHYGRDALVGIALFLTHLANYGKPVSMLRGTYPNYQISKNKIELTEDIDADAVIHELIKRYAQHPVNTEDGVKIEFDDEWVQLRKSNTEPIIRIYSESSSMATADHLAKKIMGDIREILETNNANLPR